MAQQTALFRDIETVIKVAHSRTEPSIWVRRLVIWEKPGKLIREIHLRRGLNIVWSPDAEASAASPGATGESGHGAGKTLFCRLVRYCLGEDTFATGELRQAIADAMPEGLVGAEIVLAGSTWGVVRPIGTTRRTFTGEGTPEDLLKSGLNTGIEPLLKAIRQATTGNELRGAVPFARESSEWLLALAWLTRDQECRLGHLLEWRHRRTESRSPASNANYDYLTDIVRYFVGALGAEEVEAEAQLTDLRARKASLDRGREYLDEAIKRSGPRLARDLGVDAELLAAGKLAMTALLERAQAQAQDIEKRLHIDESEDDSAVDTIRARSKVVFEQFGEVNREIARLTTLKESDERNRREIEAELASLSADALKARYGTSCPICSVPIDRALAEGCGLSHVIPTPEQIEDKKDDRLRRLDECKDSIVERQDQIKSAMAFRDQLMAESAQLDAELDAHTRAARKKEVVRRTQWLEAGRIQGDVKDLVDNLVERDRISQEIETLTGKEAKARERLVRLRERHKAIQLRLNELFGYACRGIIEASGKPKLSLFPQLKAESGAKGLAIESMTILAFDLSVLLLSIEGQTCLPAFLVHDSPREADLGLSHYHRLFRFVRQLESLGQEPPFQYIVTTTTRPPDELRCEPFVIAQLSGNDQANRLLKRTISS